MTDRIAVALKNLADAVIDEANEVVIKPIITGAAKRSLQDALFGKDGLFSTMAGATNEPAAAPTTTPKPKDTTDAKEMARIFLGYEKVDSIIALKRAGKADQAIADFLNISIDVVKIF